MTPEAEALTLDAAARCGVSGRLGEWPALLAVLLRRGCEVTGDTPGHVARELARLLLARAAQ